MKATVCPNGCWADLRRGAEGWVCWACATEWIPSCLVPDCDGEPVTMVDAIKGLCRDHAPRRPAPRKPAGWVPLSKKTRFAVLSRDGFRCTYCGAHGNGVVLHVDHAKSRRDGGTDELSNLRAACADCNHGKGRRSVREREET
jgi:hypothetical protein